MSHAVHQTKALILKVKNMRESNKLIYLYTEKFGLLYASMQSVRELRSKMKSHIHPFSIVDIDLVLGKNIWRIVGVHEQYSAFNMIETPWYRLTALVSDMVLRLCVGEEENQMLWKHLSVYFQNLYVYNEKYAAEYEIIIMVLLLDSLGYWEGDRVLLDDVGTNPYIESNFMLIKNNSFEYIKKINQSLHDSQL